jgi:hypothetical protein
LRGAGAAAMLGVLGVAGAATATGVGSAHTVRALQRCEGSVTVRSSPVVQSLCALVVAFVGWVGVQGVQHGRHLAVSASPTRLCKTGSRSSTSQQPMLHQTQQRTTNDVCALQRAGPHHNQPRSASVSTSALVKTGNTLWGAGWCCMPRNRARMWRHAGARHIIAHHPPTHTHTHTRARAHAQTHAHTHAHTTHHTTHQHT